MGAQIRRHDGRDKAHRRHPCRSRRPSTRPPRGTARRRDLWRVDTARAVANDGTNAARKVAGKAGGIVPGQGVDVPDIEMEPADFLSPACCYDGE